MSQVRCTCGAVVVDIPGALPTGIMTPCPDCDPVGYARRWSCPWPHPAPDTDIAFLRRRVAVLESQKAQAMSLATLIVREMRDDDLFNRMGQGSIMAAIMALPGADCRLMLSLIDPDLIKLEARS